MGITVSSPLPTSPFILTSTIIGFVSFAFTVFTFLKVVWANISTFEEPAHEVHSYLTDLRVELLEEKQSIRSMRKWVKKQHKQDRDEHGMELDEISLKTMEDSVRALIKRFKDLEEPFLEPGEQGIREANQHRSRRRRSLSPHYDHSAYASPDKYEKQGTKGWGKDNREEREDEEVYWAQRTEYANYNWGQRLIWLRRKSDAQSLKDSLSAVQLRRVARQVGGMAMAHHKYGSKTLDMEVMIRRIDERMGRFVGARRVDGGNS